MTPEQARTEQQRLKDLGFYRGEIDGIWGPQSRAALAASIAPAGDQVDSRSESSIATLLPKAQSAARKFMSALAAVLPEGVTAKIISGTRTYPEQDALYEQGRTKPGSRVTNARGGYSNHNFGIAWDIGIFKAGKYLDESPLYAVAGKIGREQGLEWGGDWKSIQDEPHFQLKVGKTLAELRALHDAGDLGSL